MRALLAAKPAFGLFQGAISQSNLGGFGYATTYTEYLSIADEWTSFGEGTVAAVGCANATNTLVCLQSVPAVNLINAPNAPRYSLDPFVSPPSDTLTSCGRYIVVDGKYITTGQLELDGSGPTADAHVMFGWMRDDGADFVGSFPSPTTTLTEALLGAG